VSRADGRDRNELRGQAAIVSGAGGGIGRAIALSLARAGATLAILDVDLAAAEQTASLVRESESIAWPFEVDVADIEGLPRSIAAVTERLGRVDILVNNAGIGDGLPFEAVTPQSFDRVFAVNVRGAFFLTQAVVPWMKRQGYGRIVNVSSLIAVRGAPGNPHYAGAKSALIGFTRAWALELAPHGITVNTVVPALTPTPMATATMTADALAQRAQAVPMNRLATPEDAAAVTRFLVSPAAGFVTGQALSPNGGEFVGAM
jgi:NAD(P)-dependent dehydrogenase (short-subunit alcohol dehydrogenase family)